MQIKLLVTETRCPGKYSAHACPGMVYTRRELFLKYRQPMGGAGVDARRAVDDSVEWLLTFVPELALDWNVICIAILFEACAIRFCFMANAVSREATEEGCHASL